jgi:hypothetical protein
MFHFNIMNMKKLLMIVCGTAMLGIATIAQAQDQDTASTDYNQGAVEQSQDQPIDQSQPTQDPTYAPPTQDQPTQDQPTQEQPTLDQPTQDQPTLDQPTQDPALDQPTQDQPTQDPALDQPTQDGNNQIQQGQSRESGVPTEDQTDQATESPADMTPVEDKEGPNGEAVFMENGKYYYMNEAGEKTKIKKSELRDKAQ